METVNPEVINAKTVKAKTIDAKVVKAVPIRADTVKAEFLNARRELIRLHVDDTVSWSQDFLPPHYRLGKQIDKGSYGEVFELHDQRTGTVLAIKVPRWQRKEEPGKRKLDTEHQVRRIEQQCARFDHEANILRLLHTGRAHPNIVPYIDYLGAYPKSVGAPWRGIVMARISDGAFSSVVDLLPPGHSAVWDFMWTCFEQVNAALVHCHSLKLVHRDIKANNVLMALGRLDRSRFNFREIQSRCNKLEFFLTDFEGSVRNDEGQDIRTGGTHLYNPPEGNSNKRNISPATDMYMLGVMLLTVLDVGGIREKVLKIPRDKPWTVAAQQVLYKKAIRSDPRLAPWVRLLEDDPAKRLTAVEVSRRASHWVGFGFRKDFPTFDGCPLFRGVPGAAVYKF